MGAGFRYRAELIEGFNIAFAPGQIDATRTRLGPQRTAMDALEMVHRLGLLSGVPTESFFTYRDRLGMPALHLQIMTAAFQAVLHDRRSKGAKLDIVDGPVESVLVSEVDGQTVVKLTRVATQPAGH